MSKLLPIAATIQAAATVLEGYWREACQHKDQTCEGLEEYWSEVFSKQSAPLPCREVWIQVEME